MNIKKELKKRILVMDGAIGTMIQNYNLSEEDFRGRRFINHETSLKGNNDILSLTRPDLLSEIHERYLEAGADILKTNTFNANPISMGDYNCENFVLEINRTAVKIARKAVDKFLKVNPAKLKFIAGSIGPTNRMASMSQQVDDPSSREVNFDDLFEAYFLQVEGLVDGGVDLFLIETVFDTLNAKAALKAIEELNKKKRKNIPIMISGTISDSSGRLLSGQTLEAFLVSVSHAKPLSIGLNCSTGAADMLPYLEELSIKAPFFVSAHPNAGLPNQYGEYDESPTEMADEAAHEKRPI